MCKGKLKCGQRITCSMSIHVHLLLLTCTCRKRKNIPSFNAQGHEVTEILTKQRLWRSSVLSVTVSINLFKTQLWKAQERNLK